MRFWTLNKLVVLALMGAFAILLLEIRFEHQAVLGEHLIAWMPIVYSGLMVILSFAALYLWKRGGRQVLFYAFAFALIVGVIGFWQHNEENFASRIESVFTVWGKSAPEDHHSNEAKSDEHSANGNDQPRAENHQQTKESLLPPVFAPLSFAGLGILGMLACARRFQRDYLKAEE